MTRRPLSPADHRRRRALRLLSVSGAVAYPLALVCIILALRYVGERWWITVIAMYLPRIGFALPLPFVLLAGHLWGPRRLLPLHVLSLLLVVFPLMGFNPGVRRLLIQPASPAIRLVSYNISFGGGGVSRLVAQVREFAPDLVVFQDAAAPIENRLIASFEGWDVHLDGQFFVASRYPICDVFVPPPIVYARGTGGAHFVRYTLETPLGLVDVFNVHATSPRPGLDDVRGRSLQDEITSGRLFAGTASASVEFNAYRRQRQIMGVAHAASASARPVIIAGDTNLPGLSRVLNDSLDGFRDAFSRAGWGFGYTFPPKHPWMRLDRILTNHRLRALDFKVGESAASDHRCVFAVIARDR